MSSEYFNEDGKENIWASRRRRTLGNKKERRACACACVCVCVCLTVCDLETSKMERTGPDVDCWKQKKIKIQKIFTRCSVTR